jgi:hypothetical protein
MDLNAGCSLDIPVRTNICKVESYVERLYIKNVEPSLTENYLDPLYEKSILQG